MKQSSANTLKSGKRAIRALNDVCDASCVTWFACANSKPNGVCSGFVLMNGQTRKHLDKILNEDDAIYVQNCVRMIQNGDTSEDKESLVEEVLRFIPEAERQPRESGFTAMLTATRSSNPTSQHTEQAEPRSMSGFLRMLEESSKKVSIEEAVQRALDEIATDEVKYASIERANDGIIPRQTGFATMLECARPARSVSKSQPEVRGRHGFRAMLNGASRGNATGESVETRHDVKPIPCGLAAMLEAMSPNRIHDTLNERSHIRRGMGFANMLRDAAKGTE